MMDTRVVLVAIAAGGLEAAWTYPDRGGPFSAWIGVVSLFIIFAVVTYPKIWQVPGLAIIEELSHLHIGYLFTGYTLPTFDAWLVGMYFRVFHHWSTSYIGFNAYVYVTFPVITIVGTILYAVYFRD